MVFAVYLPMLLMVFISDFQYKNEHSLLLRIVIAIIIAFVSTAVIYFYFNTITTRITKFAQAAKRMAKGNLFVDFSIQGNDEITELGESIQSVITRFGEIINGLKTNMDQLQQASKALGVTAAKLSEGASEQASSTEEVSASMEQMNANIEQNAENAKTADVIAKKSSEEIEVSSRNVKTTVRSMEDIANKTSIIGDIAFQVNILALNAAVEAARAGAHGKGFGVVANEVGKLADRSKLAALEIDELTNKSLQIAQKSGQLLEKTVPEIQKTTVLVQDITSASVEQKSGVDQINNAIQQLNNVTQQNASSAEALATNVESLVQLADRVNKLVMFFKLEDTRKNRAEKRAEAKNKATSLDTTKVEKKPIGVKTTVKTKQTTETKKVESIKSPKKDINQPEKSSKGKGSGFDLNLGNDDILDDGFEKF